MTFHFTQTSQPSDWPRLRFKDSNLLITPGPNDKVQTTNFLVHLRFKDFHLPIGKNPDSPSIFLIGRFDSNLVITLGAICLN